MTAAGALTTVSACWPVLHTAHRCHVPAILIWTGDCGSPVAAAHFCAAANDSWLSLSESSTASLTP